MWLPAVLAKPANFAQKHASLQPTSEWGNSLFGMSAHSNSENADIIWCYYTIPIVIQAWQEEQATIISELKEMGGGLIVAGDCR